MPNTVTVGPATARSDALANFETLAPGAISLPHGMIAARILERCPTEALFVYCAGPRSHGADKAAIRLARLSRHFKEKIVGITGWAEDGHEFAHEHPVAADPYVIPHAEGQH